MTSTFEVSKFSPKQIADLLSDGKDLRRFKDALVPTSQPAYRPSEIRKAKDD